MFIPVWPIILFVLIGAAIGLWFLVRCVVSQNGAPGVGIFTMVAGAIGIIVPLFVLVGNSSQNIQLAILVSGAIVFGCGAIATAIGSKKQ